MISGFHSVVIDLHEFDVGVRDYSRLLGQLPARIETNPRSQTRSAFFPLANMALELRKEEADEQVDSESTADLGSSAPSRFGLNGIRLRSDFEDAAARLTEEGVGIRSSQNEQSTCVISGDLRSWRGDAIELSTSRGLCVEIISQESTPPTQVFAGLEGTSEARRIFNGDGPEIDSAARIQSLDHVVVMSPDPESTRAFYADQLGLRLALDKSFEERGVRLIFFRVGGTTIEIGGRLGVLPRPDRSDRFGGLAWQVADAEAIQSRLIRDGFDVSEIREGNKLGTRVCTVRDPVHEVPTLLIEPVP
jgi:catechol 2,3-dioxygenase-like lactoylglutathione lyase family enzyme